MKYKITKKHKFLKKGILEVTKDRQAYIYCNRLWYPTYISINTEREWLKSGWIKIESIDYTDDIKEEVTSESVEFTKQDMISFALWCEDALLDRIDVDSADSFATIKNISKWKEDNEEF